MDRSDPHAKSRDLRSYPRKLLRKSTARIGNDEMSLTDGIIPQDHSLAGKAFLQIKYTFIIRKNCRFPGLVFLALARVSWNGSVSNELFFIYWLMVSS